MQEQKTKIEIAPLRLGIAKGTKLHRNGYTTLKIYLSKPLLKYIKDTTRPDQTRSDRISELITKGLRGDSKRPE
jgi:hypothetical protein